jgi:SAM-dependent methyltransferase
MNLVSFLKNENKMKLRPDQLYPLRPPLPLPEGVTEDQLFNWLKQVRVEGAPKEIANYCTSDFRRFVYTYGLVNEASKGIADSQGRLLELGGNPYFSAMLLKKFTSHELVLANYFGENHPTGVLSQNVDYLEFDPLNQDHAKPARVSFDYHHFNTENDLFPFEDSSFDIILFCEIIEHLLMDPAKVLREIKRILKPSGQLILTTPNVSRLENVARMLSGSNIYDPYSGYGPYGRHNREYNKHELNLLLNYLGFTIEEMYTADVHENRASNYFDLSLFQDTLKYRQADLGQYIFLRATCGGKDSGKKPSWLYRSYPAGELDD